MRTPYLHKTARSMFAGAFIILGLLGPLAADRVMAQPRSDEAVWLDEPWQFSGYTQNGHHPGRTEYLFPITATERGRFALEFGQDLQGAKVDVWANTNTGTLWLWHERRLASREVSIAWSGPQVHTVVVRVHHHTRREPTVQRFRLSRQVRDAEAAKRER